MRVIKMDDGLGAVLPDTLAAELGIIPISWSMPPPRTITGPNRHAGADGGVISVQGLDECAVVARRRLKWALPRIENALTASRGFCQTPSPRQRSTHELALTIAGSMAARSTPD